MTILDQIRARTDAATEGPWEVPLYSSPLKDEVTAPNAPGLTVPVCIVGSPAPNAEFIAHARQDVPSLLAAVDAVLALLDERAAEFRKTSDGLNALVLRRDPERNAEDAYRYSAYAAHAESDARLVRKTITATLEGATK